MATLEQYRKQALKATEKDMKRDIADSNTIYQNQAENVKGKYGTQIDLSTQEYDDLERQNEVQRYINARNVAENNASLGLTDSGLNRTQQTAVQLSASNNAAKIARDRQNMVNALTQEMNSLLTEIENNRIASKASIRKEYEQNAHNTAVSQYNAQLSAAAARQKAQQDAEADRQKAYTKLVNDLIDGDYDAQDAAAKIKLFYDGYGMGSADELTTLLKYGGLSADDYNNYLFPAIQAPKNTPYNPWAYNMVMRK